MFSLIFMIIVLEILYIYNYQYSDVQDMKEIMQRADQQ